MKKSDYYPSETIRAITEFLFIKSDYSDLEPVDLAIVTGNYYIKTVDETYELYKKGLINKYVLFTGHSSDGKGECEAEVFLKRWIELGGPEEMVIMETKATNLMENMVYSMLAIKDHGGFKECGNRILFVGKAFALRRILMSASYAGFPDIDKCQVYGTVDPAGLNIGPDCWWKSEKAKKRVFEELGRIAQYSLEGDLSIY